MIDKTLLFRHLVELSLIAIVLASFGYTAGAAIAVIPVIILGILLISIKKQTLKIRLRDLLENNEQFNELQTALSNDPELLTCVSYLYHLGSKELIQVARIVTELRDGGNQSWLAQLSKQVRKEEKT